MQVEWPIVVKHLVAVSERLLLAAVYITRVVCLIPSIYLCNLSILIYYLWEAYVMPDDHQAAERVLILIFLIISRRGLLHVAV
jgi:hypothetical protein